MLLNRSKEKGLFVLSPEKTQGNPPYAEVNRSEVFGEPDQFTPDQIRSSISSPHLLSPSGCDVARRVSQWPSRAEVPLIATSTRVFRGRFLTRRFLPRDEASRTLRNRSRPVVSLGRPESVELDNPTIAPAESCSTPAGDRNSSGSTRSWWRSSGSAEAVGDASEPAKQDAAASALQLQLEVRRPQPTAMPQYPNPVP